MSQISDRLEVLTNEYAKAFLSFTIKNCRSYDDALELADEIIYNCIYAINKDQPIDNFNAYLWSIAHNTYKRYLNNLKKKPIFDNEYIMNMQEQPISNNDEHYELIRKSLSYMTGMYRKILVMFYYDQLKIKDIALRLNISEEMVKYYLVSGRKKMKEVYSEMEQISERSFNPETLSIRMWSLDFNNIDIWNLMSRILPQQIAIVCYDKSITVEEIAKKLNVSSAFIEDEINILVKSGLIIEPTKGKYQTNFLIINEDSSRRIDNQTADMYKEYEEVINKKFIEVLPKLKELPIFKFSATDDRYYALFIYLITKIDYRNIYTDDDGYPVILSNGVRAFIYAFKKVINKILYSQTPHIGISNVLLKEDVILWAIDIGFDTGHQNGLSNKEICKTIFDVYNGLIDESKNELYAQLIQDNYLVKKNGVLYSNIAVIDKSTKELFDSINNELVKYLETGTSKTREVIKNIVGELIPKHLKQYIDGYTTTLLLHETESNFYNKLLSNNKYLQFNNLKNEPYFCNYRYK